MSGNHNNGFESSEQLCKSATAWMLGAGVFALALTAFMINADYSMSHSTREQDLVAKLYEMRTAQISIKSRVTDARQTERFLHEESFSKPPVTVVGK